MNTKITPNLCTNKALFQLDEAVGQRLTPSVLEFLKSKEFPWELLGKPLAEFVSQQIAATPANLRLRGQICAQAFLENKEQIVVEEGAIVEAGAYISGPTYIEAGATVRHGAYIRGQVYICRGAVVGHTSELKGALLLQEAKAAHFAYVGDSILGIDCNLTLGEVKVSSGLKKFGAIFGNRAQTGCNAVTNPGTILLPGAIILPNSTGQGVIEARRAFRQRSP